MNLKKTWKRFWTVDVHNHEGFTLVELIIVIAILAILSSVAVAGYSAYIKKANMQADQTMVAEIMNILTLAYYSGDLSENGYIILTTDGVENYTDIQGTKIDNAMIAAFGEGWQNALKLKYSDWKPTQGDANLLNAVQNSNQFSSDSMDELLNSVQYVTNEFAGFLENGANIDADSDLGQYLLNAGIDYTTDPQAASNATVLFVGSVFANSSASDEDIANAWLTGDYTAVTGGDPVTTNAAKYATTLALAKYVEREANLTDAPYSTRLASATGTAVISEMTAVTSELTDQYPTYVYEYYGLESADDFANGVASTSEAYKDAMAFTAYMSGMTAVSDSLLDSTDISSEGYFTNSAVMDIVNEYITVGAKLEALGVTNGIVITINDGIVISDPSSSN